MERQGEGVVWILVDWEGDEEVECLEEEVVDCSMMALDQLLLSLCQDYEGECISDY